MASFPNREADALLEWSFGPLETAPAVLAEALALPAAALTALPVDARFILEGLGFAREIVWTSEPSPDPDPHGRITFRAAEVEALVIAAQSERLWSSDLRGFCLRKLHDPTWVVTRGVALDGAEPDGGVAWSVGRVLRSLDLELVGVELATAGAERPHTTSVAA